MRLTHHSRIRMSQRGIPQRLVTFALQHGRVEGDRHVLDRRDPMRRPPLMRVLSTQAALQ